MHNFLSKIMKYRICFLQGLWANNGDALSRQYAGTNALKGDFTRTGERNLSGLMKDGMNSASRYYLNQFRDAYRQATIDLMTGQIVSESLVAGHFEEGKGYLPSPLPPPLTKIFSGVTLQLEVKSTVGGIFCQPLVAQDQRTR